MKNLVILLFFLFCSFSQGAEISYDSTFPRDNSFCHFQGQKLEFKLRGAERYTRSGDEGYGEILFVQTANKRMQIKNDSGIGRYRLLKGDSNNCFKSLSITSSEKELVMFLEKDERPLGNTLSVLYLNLQTLDHEIVDTSHLLDKAYVEKNVLYFKLQADPCKKNNGTVFINNKKFFFTEEEYSPWISFNGQNFSLEKRKTFNSYDGREFYGNENAFFETKGAEKKVTTAINHELGQKCFRFSEQESWKCTARINL